MKNNSSIALPEQDAMPLLWLGVAIAFRLFAYGLLIGAAFLYSRGLPPFINALFFPVYFLVAISSPFWVPLSAGFFSAYFWPNPETKAYVGANGVSTWLFSAICVVMLLVEGWEGLVCIAPILIFLDVSMSGRGGDLGQRFWNGRLGRQFLGDFSTDDWKDDGQNLP